MKWFELRLSVAAAMEEAVTNRLFEIGAEGVTVNEDEPLRIVSGYFTEQNRSAVLAALDEYFRSLETIFPDLPVIQSEVISVKDENWADHYKQFYQPQLLGTHFFLKPVWDVSSDIPQGKIPILMEPGQAFGTGLHQSTQLSLSLMEHAIDQLCDPDRRSLLDVGTGTGILAIAARKLGIGSVTAIDNDPVAVETALENVNKNNCADVHISGNPLSLLKEPFDIIVSNILLETHRQLCGEYLRLLKPGGILILSGLLAQQKNEIENLFAQSPALLERAETRQEWLALLYVLGGLKPSSKIKKHP